MPELALNEVWQVGVVGKECVARAYVRSDSEAERMRPKKNEWKECSRVLHAASAPVQLGVVETVRMSVQMFAEVR
jgi:hypothetical protein